jgi:glucosamine-6-phosphate deaminase
MMHQIGEFNVYIEKDYDSMSKVGARILAAQVTLTPRSVLGLATGGTPVGAYKELVRMHRAGELDFSAVTTFNLDEYYPISRQNNQSYYYFMHDNLFAHVNIPSGNINIPNGEAADAAEECAAYEKKLAAAGGVDIQLLGIGVTGHIAFNEPAEAFEPFTHVVDLAEKTIAANSRFFASADDVPRQALTMGIKSIMSAKRILLMASGADKAEVIAKMILGGITPSLTASVLQLHPRVDVVLTEDAATGLGIR